MMLSGFQGRHWTRTSWLDETEFCSQAGHMNSRERVLTTFDHREPDRVPIDFSGHRSSGIAAMAYARLRDFLGLPKLPIRVYDPVQQLAIVDEDVLQRFGVDTIELGRAFAREDNNWTDWVLPDGTPCLMPVWAKPERDGSDWVLRAERSGIPIARMPAGVWYFEQTHFPFQNAEISMILRLLLQSACGRQSALPQGQSPAAKQARNS